MAVTLFSDNVPFDIHVISDENDSLELTDDPLSQSKLNRRRPFMKGSKKGGKKKVKKGHLCFDEEDTF